MRRAPRFARRVHCQWTRIFKLIQFTSEKHFKLVLFKFFWIKNLNRDGDARAITTRMIPGPPARDPGTVGLRLRRADSDSDSGSGSEVPATVSGAGTKLLL